MSEIQSLIYQQLGSLHWKDESIPLSRLRCSRNKEYSQILPGEWSTEGMEQPILACKFSQKQGYEHLLALANEDGKLAIHNVENTKSWYGCDAHRNAIFDLAWMFDQMKLVTVSGDHSARLQEVGESEIKQTQVFNGHTRSIKTIAFRYKDSNVFATGGRDGTILTWDTRHSQSTVAKVDCCLYNTHRYRKTRKNNKKMMCTAVSGTDSVTGLVFQDENSLISCGAGDGLIKVWDMRKTYSNYSQTPVPKFVLPYPGKTSKNGFSNLSLDRATMKLYVNCLDNAIYCYNVGTYDINPHMKYVGHENSTFYIKSCLSPNGKYLISGSSDHNAYIWDVKSGEPLVKLTGHQAEVTCVAWCPTHEMIIVTCSDDLKHKFWEVGGENLPDNWEVEGAGIAEKVLKKKLRSSKRNKAKRGLEVDKNEVVLVKRCLSERGTENHNKMLKSPFGPRKLFINNDHCSGEQLFKTYVKTNEESENFESPLKKVKYDKENEDVNDFNALFIFPKDHESDIPLKKIKLEPCGSCTTPPESEKTNLTASVISDLPNFVIDGRAPHLNVSPLKKVEKDWLTKIRVEKNLSPSSSPKSNKPEACMTPKSRQKLKAGAPSSPHSPLLSFFKVTSNNSQQCSPKSSSLCSFTSQSTC